MSGAFLVVQWLRLHAPNAGGLGLIPGQAARSNTPQVRVRMPQLRPGAANQSINKFLKKKKKERMSDTA